MSIIKKHLRIIAHRFPIARKVRHEYTIIRNKLRSKLDSRVVTDSRLVIFEVFNGRAYSDSPKAIYEQLISDDKYSDYRFIWALRDPEDYKFLLENPRTSIVKYKSKQYFRAYAESKYWVVNAMIPLRITKKPDQVLLQCWHGTPLKRLRNDIIQNTKNAMNSLDDFIRKNKLDTKRYDYFVSPSRFASEKFTTAFDLEELGKQDILIETGYPRNDFLFSSTDEDISNIKDRLRLPKNKKVILYAPTWRDDQHTASEGYIYESPVDFDFLRDKLSNDYIILFRAHYMVADNFDFEKYQGFIYDVSSEDDVSNLYVISDALITDYSSVFFDYANLKRPIIFYMYDLDHYQNELRGFYLDLDELPGAIMKTEKQVVSALQNLDGYNKKYKSTYDKFNDKFNYLDDSHASKRVIDKVFSDK